MKKTVIITSYIEEPLDINKNLSSGDYVICTDGGYDIAAKQQIIPDLLLGDFDSIESEIPKDVAIKRFNPEKDYTDLELAIKTAIDMKSDNVEIFGGIGGRLDHTVANLQLLSHYSNNFNALIMRDNRNKCFVLYGDPQKTHEIPKEEDSYISLFSLSEKCSGVTILGVKYPLYSHSLTRIFPLGVSNEFQEKSASLSVTSGTLLVIISKK